jgi:uncharacterized SAM-binding protein YcdF (DUF218 family)
MLPANRIMSCADALWRFHNIAVDQPSAADLVIGLGSYFLGVADRAAELILQGTAPRVLFCGGEGNWTRGRWAQSEAERFRDRALALGVPSAAILVETTSSNIGANFFNARRFLEAAGLSPHKLIVVTKPNTTRRAQLTQAIVWPDVQVEYCAPSVHWTEQLAGDMTVDDIICEMVGDLQRILIYPDRGFQARELVPDEILECYDILVAAGFDKHLIQGR